MISVVLKLIALVLGGFIVLGTLYDAALTTIHPRPNNNWLATQTFRVVYLLFRVPLGFARTQAARRRVIGIFGMLALVCVPFVWIFSVTLGFACVFWSLGVGTPFRALIASGSALSTLGFDTPPQGIEELLSIIGGALGVGLIGFWITFLPGIVAIGTQRDELVSQFTLVAGTPPSGLTVLETYYVAHQADQLDEKWTEWTNWFVFLGDTHPQMPVISTVRSVRPELSWVTTAGAILDVAALAVTTIDQPARLQVTLCLRTGIATLIEIEAALQSVFRGGPHARAAHRPDELSRAAFDTACERMARVGITLKADRDQAFHEFSAWHAQYGPGLEALARAVAAPLDPWLE